MPAATSSTRQTARYLVAPGGGRQGKGARDHALRSGAIQDLRPRLLDQPKRREGATPLETEGQLSRAAKPEAPSCRRVTAAGGLLESLVQLAGRISLDHRCAAISGVPAWRSCRGQPCRRGRTSGGIWR